MAGITAEIFNFSKALLKRLVKGPSKEPFGLVAAAQRHLLLWVKVRGKSAGKESETTPMRRSAGRRI